MLPNQNQAENTVVDTRIAVRRKLLASLIAGGGALVLAACGGGSSDSSQPDAVANRSRRGGTAANPSTDNTADTLQSTIGDAAQQMQMPHEARPWGVAVSPQFPWADAPIVYNPTPPAGMTAMIGFGDVHFAEGAPTPVGGDTIQLRNFKTYILTSSNQLVLVQNPDTITGAQYYPDYRDDTHFQAQMSNSGGVTSVVLDPAMTFHFFPADRIQIDPANVKGVVVAVEAKVSSPAGTTDPNINNLYLMGMGADWWTTVNAQWDNQTTNPGVGDGRYVFLTTSWQAYTFTSIKAPSASVAAMSFAC